MAEQEKNDKTKEQETTKILSLSDRNLKIGLLALIVFVSLVIIGASFYVLSESRTMPQGLRRGQIEESFGGRRGMMGERGLGLKGRGMMYSQNSVQGKVTAIAGQTITIDKAGQSKTVKISDSTRYGLESSTKIVVGDIIQVFGSQDSSGVIQAELIQVNPS